MLSFGPRSVMGAFQLPVFGSRPWGAESFSFALAAQNLLWGIGQPFAGALADRFGSKYVLVAGALLYSAGLALMAKANSALGFDLGAGVLIGFGLSGASFNLVLGSFAKLLPPKRLSYAFGAATAAGSFGQFLFSPLAGGLIERFGWEGAALVFAALILPIVPLSLALVQPARGLHGEWRRPRRDLPRMRSGINPMCCWWLGFFTCGFQLAFITVHFQRYIVESGLSPAIGYLGHRAGRRLQYFRLPAVRLARHVGSPPLHPVRDLFFPRRSHRFVHRLAPKPDVGPGVRRGHRPALALHRAADLVADRNDVRRRAACRCSTASPFSRIRSAAFSVCCSAAISAKVSGSYTPVWLLSIALGLVSGLLNLPIVEGAGRSR